VIIGVSVQDFGHRAFLEGLRRRWCPEAQTIRGRTRGRSGISVRRDTPKVCSELQAKGADVVVLLTDADSGEWREVLAEERGRVPSQFEHRVICGVAARNVECWLVVDRPHAAKTMGIPEDELGVGDPKPVVHRALGITTFCHKVEEIAEIVRTMHLGPALIRSDEAARSLKALYDDARRYALQHGCCGFPNELEAS
jgi:hypothetical protein